MEPSHSILNDLGKVDNLQDPVPWMNRKDVIFGLISSFLALSSLGAIGRLSIRAFITRNLGLDDLFVFLSMICNIVACTAAFILVSSAGLGQHFLELGGFEGMERFLKVFYVGNAIYPASAAAMKLALLFQYTRMLEEGSKLRITTTITIIVVSLWGIAFTVLAWVPCIPIYAFWDLTIQGNTVTRYGFGSHDARTLTATFVSHAASNMFLDLLVFAIPMPLCLRSSVERKTRLALVGLFVMGVIVNMCSVVRLIMLVDSHATTYPTFDPSWYGCAPIVLSVLECQLATICASLPVFWPIVKDVWENKRIMVTREVHIRRESRKLDDSDNADAYSLNRVPSYQSWTKIMGEHQYGIRSTTGVAGPAVHGPSVSCSTTRHGSHTSDWDVPDSHSGPKPHPFVVSRRTDSNET